MNKILALIDFSERSEHAAEFAWRLAIHTQAEVVLYNAFVYVPQPEDLFAGIFSVRMRSFSAFEAESMEKLNALAKKLTVKLKKEGELRVPKYKCENSMGELGENIKELAAKESYWMIVMGNKRHESSFDFILGHDSNAVISNATCPVLMIPQPLEMGSLKRIAFALEQVDNIDSKALNFLVEFSEPFDAEIFVTHVITPKEADVSHQQLVGSFTQEAVKYDYDEISFYDIQGYDITKTLLQFEQVANIDLIAVVHRRYGFVQRLFHHSVTKQLMDYHKVPLLVFPEGYL